MRNRSRKLSSMNRVHQTLRVTLALEAKVMDRTWDVEDIVKMIEDEEAALAPKVRGPYRKRSAQIS